jgi:hypothetical protein
MRRLRGGMLTPLTLRLQYLPRAARKDAARFVFPERIADAAARMRAS